MTDEDAMRASPEQLHVMVDSIVASMNDEAMWEVNSGDKAKGGMLLRYVEDLSRALTATAPAVGSEVLCEYCARVFCPHAERLHFHHDGCPACGEHP